VRVCDLITGMKVVFMRLEQGRLNLKDSYESEWIGGTIGDLELSCISTDGRPITGITSFVGSHIDGLMLVPAERVAEIVAGASTRPTQVEAARLAALQSDADELARHGRFAAAAQVYSELYASKPADLLAFLSLAVATLESGDLPAYQERCHEALLRLGDSNDLSTARRLSNACLLVPLEPADLQKACRLATFAIGQKQEPKFLVHARFNSGLAELRQGNYREAIRRFQPRALLARTSGLPDGTTRNKNFSARDGHER